MWQLRHAGISIQEDGGDIIHARLPSSDTVSIHLIESPIPAYEIKNTLAYNAANGMHTMFILWCDMLLPPDDHVIEPHDWEWALLALYGDRIYAYEVFGQEIFVFPVYFEPYKQFRHIRYGETLDMATMIGINVEASVSGMQDQWKVVGFSEKARQTYSGSGNERQHHARPASPTSQLNAYYTLLGIQADAEPETIKTAYRRLARKLHPDTNNAPDATEKMQALNEAYHHIMATFEQADSTD